MQHFPGGKYDANDDDEGSSKSPQYDSEGSISASKWAASPRAADDSISAPSWGATPLYVASKTTTRLAVATTIPEAMSTPPAIWKRETLPSNAIYGFRKDARAEIKKKNVRAEIKKEREEEVADQHYLK